MSIECVLHHPFVTSMGASNPCIVQKSKGPIPCHPFTQQTTQDQSHSEPPSTIWTTLAACHGCGADQVACQTANGDTYSKQ